MAAFKTWPSGIAARCELASRQHSGPQRQATPRGGECPVRKQVRLLLLVGVACVAGTATSVAYYTRAGQPPPAQPSPAMELGASAPRESTGSKPTIRLADATDSWLQSLLNPLFWGRGRSETGRSRRDAQPRDRPHRARPSPKTQDIRSQGVRYQSIRPDSGATYRTMCVRLCDGYYWPVSFTATKREFARDGEICERSCDSPVALHVYRNPGEEPEDMVDLKGQPYAKLGNAFRYRVSYDSACKCRPHPWEEAARQRHLSYTRSDQLHATATRKP